jgi:hypothetical protein
LSLFALGTDGLLGLAASSGVGSSEEFPVPDGTYVRWAAGGGLEAWIRLGPGRYPIGHAIHLVGPARFRMQLVERRRRDDDVLAGGFVGRSADASDFGFESPDFRRHDDLGLPAELDVQLAALATTMELVPESPASAPFLPGASPRPIDATDPSTVTLTGRVLRAATRRDPVGGTFLWLLLGTPDGAIDAVVPAGIDVPDPPRDQLVRLTARLTGLLQPPGPAAALPRARGVERSAK